MVYLEATSKRQSTPHLAVETLSWLKRAYSRPSEDSHLLSDFRFDALPFFIYSTSFLIHQKGDDLLNFDFDFNMFEVAGATSMYKRLQAVSLHSWAIAHHLELREHFDGKSISKLKEKLVKLREAHFREIHSLEDKVKKAEDKWYPKRKGEGAQEQILQDKVAFLEKKLKEHEDLYATKVAQLKEVLNALVREVENIEGVTSPIFV